MTLLIAGHERSGTTLLRNLCHAHPEMAVTMEFANFHGLGQEKRAYVRRLIRHWQRNRRRSFLIQGKDETKTANVLKSHLFVMRYLFLIYTQGRPRVYGTVLDDVLRQLFPQARVVGDKMPNYIWKLDRFAAVPDLHCIVIYRDPRDVANSVFRMNRTVWANQSFVDQLDSAEKVARRWCRSAELMERNSKEVHLIKYEDLITDPGPVLDGIGELLSVDPAGFPSDMIRSPRSNKDSRPELTESALEKIVEIAGPTMARLGYM